MVLKENLEGIPKLGINQKELTWVRRYSQGRRGEILEGPMAAMNQSKG